MWTVTIKPASLQAFLAASARPESSGCVIRIPGSRALHLVHRDQGAGSQQQAEAAAAMVTAQGPFTLQTQAQLYVTSNEVKAKLAHPVQEGVRN